MTRELKKVLEWVRENMETVNSYPRLFRTTLEYIQYLCNNKRDISALHNTISKIVRRDTPSSAPGQNQRDRLNEFHGHLCRLADAIETDQTGSWGDTTTPEFAKDYQDRKTHFEARMQAEWETIQELINQRELQLYRTWNIL